MVAVNISQPADAALRSQATASLHDAIRWVQMHALPIAIASVVGVGLFLLLNVFRRWGLRLCRRSAGVGDWYSVGGRVIARTSQVFIIMTSARLVIGYTDAPPL